MDRKIKSCPFCGAPGRIEPLADGVQLYVGMCTGPMSDRFICNARTWTCTTEKTALKAWNRRAPLRSPAAKGVWGAISGPKVDPNICRPSPSPEDGGQKK